MVKKALFIGAVLFTLLFFFALYYWVVYIKELPWWFALTLISGIIGLIIFVLFVRKFILRARERKFIQRIISQDEAGIKAAPVSARYQLQELQEHWRKAIEELRQSHLRKKGNPLYILPWFLILGESGAGKTTAIQNSRLSSPQTDVSKTAGISGTRNCDWWFFNEAIFLDTAGRYSIPVDETRDREEWQEFLGLLSKYRKKEPLNGVIVTIAADKLVEENSAELKADGQNIRKRIDHLMHVLGAKFPVYVLVTKMDLVLGFVPFFEQIPRERIAQAMGYMNTDRFTGWMDIVQELQEQIAAILRELRLLLVHAEDSLKPGTLLFPSEFDRLFVPLRSFLNDIFEENPYQETPYFRGLFFSSAKKQGALIPDFLQLSLPDDQNPPAAPVDEDFFLRDFFEKILPADRLLFQPLKELIVWRRLTSRLGLLALFLVTLAIGGLLSFSFLQNIRTIQAFTSNFYSPPILTHKTGTDLLILEKLRNELRDLEIMNQSWFSFHFIYDQSLRAEKLMKEHYSTLIQERLLKNFESDIGRKIERITPNSPDQEIGGFVDYFQYRIYLLNLYSNGDAEKLPDRFRAVSARMLMGQDPELTEEMAAKFGDIYLTHLRYNFPDQETKAEKNALELSLYNILVKQGEGWRWFVRNWTLSDWNGDAPDVKITDFCGNLEQQRTRDIIAVAGIYTKAGRDFLNNYKISVERNTSSRSRIPVDPEFWPWYYQHFFKQWLTFSQYFGGWIRDLEKSSDWEFMATLMTTERNPAFQLITKMAEEFRIVPAEVVVPDWAKMVIRLDDIRQLAEVERQKEGGSVAAKLTGTKENLIKKTLETVDTRKAKELEYNLTLAKAWSEYLLSLQKIESSLYSEEACFKLARGYFAPDTATENSLEDLYAAYVKYSKFMNLMAGEDKLSIGSDLVYEPLDFLVTYASERTSCVLQKLWDKEVLSEVRGIDSAQIPHLLFNKADGAVWKFVDGIAKPFIDKGKKGFSSHRVRNTEIHFSNDFFHYLNEGREGSITGKPEYEVLIEGLPLEVNPDALIAPFACAVQLSCAKEKQYFENYNYPLSTTFRWSPDSCGRTLIIIYFPELTLYKEYQGNLAFAKFLLEFRDGKKTFTRNDFPESSEIMSQKNITEVTLTYDITGADEIIRLLKKVPENALPTIVHCVWS